MEKTTLKKIKGIREGSQTHIILKHMKEVGPITKKEAIERYGFTSFPQTIDYIKNDLGYELTKTALLVDGKVEAYMFGLANPNEKIILNTDKPKQIVLPAEPSTANVKILSLDTNEPPTTNDMKLKTTMRQVILEHLTKYGKINAVEAMEKYGCLNLSPMIAVLRKDGYKIVRENGKTHKDFNVHSNRSVACAVYHLINTKTINKYAIINIEYLGGEIVSIIPEKEIFDKEEKALVYMETYTNKRVRKDDELYKRYIASDKIEIYKTHTNSGLFSKKISEERVALVSLMKFVETVEA